MSVEYALLIAFIAIVSVVAMLVIGDSLHEYFLALADGIRSGTEQTMDCFAEPPYKLDCD